MKYTLTEGKYAILANTGDLQQLRIYDSDNKNIRTYSAKYATPLMHIVNSMKDQATNTTTEADGTLTHYALIDHVGKFEPHTTFRDLRNNSDKVFNVTKRTDKETLFDAFNSLVYYEVKQHLITDYKYTKANIFTVKQAVQNESDNPNCEPSQAQKNWIRQTKNPTKVIVLCDSIKDKNAQSAYQQWTNRGIDTELVEVTPYEQDKQFYETDDLIAQEKRTLAKYFSGAMYYSFSAQIDRDATVNAIDIYSARSDYKTLKSQGVDHLTKVSSKPTSYLEYSKRIASDKEINDFYKYFMAIYEDRRFNLADFFDIDYRFCDNPSCILDLPTLGLHIPKAFRATQDTDKDENQKRTEYIICPHCGKRYPKDTITQTRYFEDIIEDEPYID